MDRIQLKQNIDFLNIAAECIESGDYEVADDFVSSVLDEVDGSVENNLEKASEALDKERAESAADSVGAAVDELKGEL